MNDDWRQINMVASQLIGGDCEPIKTILSCSKVDFLTVRCVALLFTLCLNLVMSFQIERGIFWYKIQINHLYLSTVLYDTSSAANTISFFFCSVFSFALCLVFLVCDKLRFLCEHLNKRSFWCKSIDNNIPLGFNFSNFEWYFSVLFHKPCRCFTLKKTFRVDFVS